MKKVIKDFKETFNVYATYDTEQYKTKKNSFFIWRFILAIFAAILFFGISFISVALDMSYAGRVIMLMLGGTFACVPAALCLLYTRALDKIEKSEKVEAETAETNRMFRIAREAYYG